MLEFGNYQKMKINNSINKDHDNSNKENELREIKESKLTEGYCLKPVDS